MISAAAILPEGTSMTAPVASGWSDRTHWKAPTCHGAHVKRSLGIVTVDAAVWECRHLSDDDFRLFAIPGRALTARLVPMTFGGRDFAVSSSSHEVDEN
jgi:hypothetical protein